MKQVISVKDLEEMVRSGANQWGPVFALAMAYDDLAATVEEQCAKSHGGPACTARAVDSLTTEISMLEGLQKKGTLPKAELDNLAQAKDRLQKLKRAGL